MSAAEKPASSLSSEEAPAHTKHSVFAANLEEVYDIPVSILNRPIPSVLDEAKVCTFMDDVEKGDTFTPIEVLRCKSSKPGPNFGQTYYFSLGGCHRYEAHKRLGKETIRAKIIDVPPSTIQKYLGASFQG